MSNRVSRRQARRWGEQEAAAEPQYAPPPPEPAYAAPPPVDPIERLTQLGKLHEQGVLTDAEFAVEKSKILGT